MTASPRLLLVDDHALFREGVESIVSVRRPNAELVCCESVDAAEQALRSGDFDLVLLDIDLGRENGIEVLAGWRATWPRLPVLMLSASLEPGVLNRVLAAGANGFVPKVCSGAILVSAIDLVLAGGMYLPAELMPGANAPMASHTSIDDLPLDEALAAPSLTPRQQDVLALLAEGCSNKEIARRLDMADGTVRTHINAVFRVLDVCNRTQAVIRGQQLGCL